jgi:hypothetical protein
MDSGLKGTRRRLSWDCPECAFRNSGSTLMCALDFHVRLVRCVCVKGRGGRHWSASSEVDGNEKTRWRETVLRVQVAWVHVLNVGSERCVRTCSANGCTAGFSSSLFFLQYLKQRLSSVHTTLQPRITEGYRAPSPRKAKMQSRNGRHGV